MFETILFEKEDGIATITLNRPQVLNAMNYQMWRELETAVIMCEEDPEVRVVVMKGAGRAFCTGDDFIGGTDVPEWWDAEMVNQTAYFNIIKRLWYLRKPVIGSVHGYALAAGLDMALVSDIVITTKDTKFGAIYATRGFTGATYLLTKFVGLRKALELQLTGEMIDGTEAERIGLVTKAVPADELDATVKELATKFAKAATKAIGYAKRGVHEAMTLDLEAGLHEQSHMSYYGHQLEDEKEGIRAFKEKREPRFTGR